MKVIELNKGLLKTKGKVKIGGCVAEIEKSFYHRMKLNYTGCTEDQKGKIRRFVENERVFSTGMEDMLETTKKMVDIIDSVKTVFGIATIGAGILTHSPVLILKGFESL